MPNLLDDNYRCILGSYNLSQIVVLYGLTVIWATIGRRKRKIVSAEKVKSANISTERQEVQTSWKGWLILSFKHTPHSDLCLNNKAKCYNLLPPRNIRCITSKRCRIARKDIDGQRKEEKCSASLLFDNKEKLDRKKEVDEVSGAVLHLF